MLSVMLVLLMTLVAILQPAAEPVVDTRFGTNPVRLRYEAPLSERIRGSLEQGWSDNSGWADVHVRYEVAEEAGQRFQRVIVERIDNGRVQLTHPLPAFDGDVFHVLRLRARASRPSTIETGVRLDSAPWTWLWSRQVALSTEWRDIELIGPVPGHDQPAGWYLYVLEPLTVDLASASLIRLTRDQLASHFRIAGMSTDHFNLSRDTAFPLGIPTGWALGREVNDEDPVASIGALGPSGVESLKLRGPVELTSSPFAVVDHFSPHVVSVFARGSGRLDLALRTGNRDLARGSLELDPVEWRRHWLRFDPVPLAERGHVVRLVGDADIEIDGLQIEAGETPGDLRSEPRLAIASAARDSIVFDNEPHTVRVRSIHADRNTRVRLTMTDVWGSTREIIAPLVEGAATVALTDPPATQFGAVRVEAALIDMSGRELAPAREVVLHRLRSPRLRDRDGLASPFGVHCAAVGRQLRMAKAIGANWVRLHDAADRLTGWHFVEPSAGEWSFDDDSVDRIRSHRLMILGMLSTAPRWASLMQEPWYDYFDKFYPPRDLSEWSNYVRTVVGRYRGRIDHWDVWNEPWNDAWWPAGLDPSKEGSARYVRAPDAPEQYVKLQQAAFDAARDANPDAVIVGLNSTDSLPGETNFGGAEWTQRWLAGGGLQTCQVVGYHQYASGVALMPDDFVQRGLSTAVGALSPAPRVWFTEGQATLGLTRDGLYSRTLVHASQEHVPVTADRLARHVIALLARGIEKTFVYSMHGYNDLENPGEWNILVTGDGALHPSAGAYSTMAWHLEGLHFDRHVPLTDDAHAWVFAGAERAVVVVAPHAGFRGIVRVGTGEPLDLFGNPPPDRTFGGPWVGYVTTTPHRIDDVIRSLDVIAP
jgi:hypothetical protein